MTDFITDAERSRCETLEAVMAAIHRVTSAYREIDNPKQPEDFKRRLRADLPERYRSMKDACSFAAEMEIPA
jgi:hypothetical protein